MGGSSTNNHADQYSSEPQKPAPPTQQWKKPVQYGYQSYTDTGSNGGDYDIGLVGQGSSSSKKSDGVSSHSRSPSSSARDSTASAQKKKRRPSKTREPTKV